MVGPIELTTPISAVDENGNAQTIGAELRISLRVKNEEGRKRLLQRTPDQQDTILARIIRLAQQRPEIARALDLLERDPSWSDIYLLMEIVETSLRRDATFRGKDWVAIEAQKWLPSATVRSIKRNAGFHRHAKQFSPPHPMMPLGDAQEKCKQVMRGWLEKLATAEVSP